MDTDEFKVSEETENVIKHIEKSKIKLKEEVKKLINNFEMETGLIVENAFYYQDLNKKLYIHLKSF